MGEIIYFKFFNYIDRLYLVFLIFILVERGEEVIKY